MKNTKCNTQRRRNLQAGLALGLGGALWRVGPKAAAAEPTASLGQGASEFWKLLGQGGCVVLMRHAQTEPGLGDPPGFQLQRCETQRNLSPEGKRDAQRLGAAFRSRGIALQSVRSSAWCRCIDTATLAFGRNEVWPPLNSFFEDRSTELQQTQQVLAAISQMPSGQNWVLVTHQVNITALTGSWTDMGEMLLVRPHVRKDGRLVVLARAMI